MPKLLLTALCISILSVAPVVQGAEFELHPSLAVSEEFTDNVFETNSNRTSDYITRTLPGVAMSYKAPALTGNLDYVFDYRYYARKNREDEIAHSLNAKSHLTAVENLLFLDISDEYQRVSLDVTRDVTKESLFLNQTDRNVATASPYFTLHPTERIALKSGYRFIDTRYFSQFGIDKTEHIAFLNMAYEISKRWSLTADYIFIRELAVINNFSQHQALGGFRYEYADKSFIFAQAGNTWISYDSGQRFNSIIWNAGFTHVFDTVTATITTGMKYNEDPLLNIQQVQERFVNGALEMRFQRGTLNLSPYYSVFVQTENDILQTKKYGATVSGSYEITSKLNGRLAFTAEKYEQPFIGNDTKRLQVDSSLSYLLAKQVTASLSYIYVSYYSPDSAVDNRHVNRAMVEIKKVF
jgi:hypothetical protein